MAEPARAPEQARPQRPPTGKPPGQARGRAWYRDPVLIPFVLAVVGLDQLTKWLVASNLAVGEHWPAHGEFYITRIYNSGSAFGFFPSQTLFLIFGSLIGIGALLVLYHNHPFPGFLLRASLVFQLGGALGNLIDRLRAGAVLDFVALAWWPVWNLADASILTGIGILIFLMVFPPKVKTGPAPQAPPAEAVAPPPPYVKLPLMLPPPSANHRTPPALPPPSGDILRLPAAEEAPSGDKPHLES